MVLNKTHTKTNQYNNIFTFHLQTCIVTVFIFRSTKEQERKRMIKNKIGNVVFIVSLLLSYVGIFNLTGNFPQSMTDTWLEVTGISLFEDLVLYQSFKAIFTLVAKMIIVSFEASDNACEELLKMLIGLFSIA
jgi:hypothetical protein